MNGKAKQKKKYFGRGEDAQLKASLFDSEVSTKKKKTKITDTGPTFGELTVGYQKAKYRNAGGITESGKYNTYYMMRANVLSLFGCVQTMGFKSALNVVSAQKGA